jgi:Rieske Fe-S protein
MSDNRKTRRAMLAAAAGATATAALTGCAVYGDSNTAAPAPPAATKPAPTKSGKGKKPAEKPAPPAGPVLAKVGDIPVGSGKIFKDEQVVVTQPQPGTVKAFSVTCTHQGCPVSEIKNGTINCLCHGSKFNVADGSVAKGPANKPLAPVAVTVAGDAIHLG